MLSFSPAQQWAVAITRHISGNLSAAASSIIIYRVVVRMLKDKKAGGTGSVAVGTSERWVTPYHRLMLGFSIADVLYSFWVGLSTLVVPASTGVIYGYGTTATCSAQGFFMQFGVASYLYLAVLSIYFWLKIRYNVSDDVLCRHYEVWFHVVPWSVALGTGSMGLTLQLYNPVPIPLAGCWLGSYPAECFFPHGPPCTRGGRIKDSATFYAFAMAYAWLFISFVVVAWTNTMIYQTIRHQERRNERYLAARLQNDATVSFTVSPQPRRLSLGAAPTEKEQLAPSLANVPSVAVGVEMEPTMSSQADDNNHAPCEHTAMDKTMENVKVDGSGTGQSMDHTVESNVSTVLPMPHRRRSSATIQHNQRDNVKASRTAFVQSILYVSSAGFTAIWLFSPYVTLKMKLTRHWNFAAVLLMSIFVPLQGLFNLLIYVRPEYLRLRRRSSSNNWSRWRCLRHCLFSFDPGAASKRCRNSARVACQCE